MRWPSPNARRASSARTPVASGSTMGFRAKGRGGGAFSERVDHAPEQLLPHLGARLTRPEEHACPRRDPRGRAKWSGEQSIVAKPDHLERDALGPPCALGHVDLELASDRGADPRDLHEQAYDLLDASLGANERHRARSADVV